MADGGGSDDMEGYEQEAVLVTDSMDSLLIGP
jgi:hypothetical protein